MLSNWYWWNVALTVLRFDNWIPSRSCRISILLLHNQSLHPHRTMWWYIWYIGKTTPKWLSLASDFLLPEVVYTSSSALVLTSNQNIFPFIHVARPKLDLRLQADIIAVESELMTARLRVPPIYLRFFPDMILSVKAESSTEKITRKNHS